MSVILFRQEQALAIQLNIISKSIAVEQLFRRAGQIAKKAVIFCQFEFVGVRWYGRVQIGKKQVTARKIRCFPCGFIIIILFRQEQAPSPLRSAINACHRQASPLRLNTPIKSLAVERLFRRSEGM